MTDDEWMQAQDREGRLATFQNMTRVWPVRKPAPVIPKDRQMEIALAALAAQGAREGGTEKAA